MYDTELYCAGLSGIHVHAKFRTLYTYIHSVTLNYRSRPSREVLADAADKAGLPASAPKLPIYIYIPPDQ